jgi:hypothetical protein
MLGTVSCVALAATAVITALGQTAQAESPAGETISRADILARAAHWYGQRGSMTYNSSRAASTLVADVEGDHRYGPDCSGLVSMAWHLPPGSSGGLNTGTLPQVARTIPREELAPGDMLDDVADGHVILFDQWDADRSHFSYYSFGATPMEHRTGATFDAAQLSGHPTAHYQAYRYVKVEDGPSTPSTRRRVGVLTTRGAVKVKEGALDATWAPPATGPDGAKEPVKAVVMEGDRIGVLTADRRLRVREGALDAEWTHVADGVLQFDLDQDRIGIVTTRGAVKVKEGALDAEWTTQRDKDATTVHLSGQRIGILTKSDKHLITKEGELTTTDNKTTDRLHEAYYVEQFDLDGDRIAITTTDGIVYVKEGALDAEWTTQRDTDAAAVHLSGRRIGILTKSDKHLIVKDGELTTTDDNTTNWLHEAYNVKQFDLAGNRIAITTTDGTVHVKEGALDAEWTTQHDKDATTVHLT